MECYTLEINTGEGLQVEGVFASLAMAQEQGIKRVLEEIDPSQGDAEWFELLLEAREAHHAMYGEAEGFATGQVDILRSENCDLSERYEAAAEIMRWLDGDAEMRVNGHTMIEPVPVPTRLYRYRVFDSRNGYEYGQLDLEFENDEQATAEAVDMRVMLGVMCDEIRYVDGEQPIEGEEYEAGQWRAILALRDVVTA